MTIAVTAAMSTSSTRTMRRTRAPSVARAGEERSCSSQLPYSETTVWRREGSLRSIQDAV
jgi:hypothetical protein